MGFSMGNVVIKAETGKTFNMKEVLRRSEQGGGSRVLDKPAIDLLGTYKCGFWPGCTGTVSGTDISVRGGVVAKPDDHAKMGQFVYICGVHVEQKYESENTDDEDAAGASVSLMGGSDEDNGDQEEDFEQKKGEADSTDDDGGDKFEEFGQLQSLLGRHK